MRLTGKLTYAMNRFHHQWQIALFACLGLVGCLAGRDTNADQNGALVKPNLAQPTQRPLKLQSQPDFRAGVQAMPRLVEGSSTVVASINAAMDTLDAIALSGCDNLSREVTVKSSGPELLVINEYVDYFCGAYLVTDSRTGLDPI